MEPLVSAQELYEATREIRKELAEKTREQLLEEWMEWFMKKGPSYIRDSVKKGLFKVSLELPFQPVFQEDGAVDPKSYSWNGKSLWKRLQDLLPGCTIIYMEEELDAGEIYYSLEIGWKLKKKKKGFVAEVAEESVVPTTSTTSTASTMSTSTTMSTATAVTSSTSSDTSTVSS
jgi:hypothetical protein